MEQVGDQSDRQWDCGWDEHKRRQMLRLAKLPLAEKLAWLEEAQRLVDTLTRERAKKRGKDAVDRE